MIQLIITRNEQTGVVSVTGPIADKFTCYGLLGAARDVIASFQPPAVKPASLAELGKLASNGRH